MHAGETYTHTSVDATPPRSISGRLTRLVLAASLLLSATGAGAAPTFFTNDPAADRAAFQATAGGGLVLESFEDAFASGTSLSFPVGGPQAFSLTAGLTMNFETTLVGRLVSAGASAVSFPELPSTTLVFTFDTPVVAFGLDVNDINWGTMSFSDNLGNLANDILLGDNCNSAGGPSCTNLQFFGVTNTDPFSSVSLNFTNVSQATGTLSVDRLEFLPAAVPAPGTAVLFGLGLMAAGVAARGHRPRART